MTTSGAAAVAHEQHVLAAALRCRQIRPRRIALVGSNGGVGTTTAAVLLASVLSGARDDKTLLLAVHSDPSDVAARLSLPHAPSVTEVLAGMRRHGRIPPTPVTRTGLRVLSAPRPGTAPVDSGLAALLDLAASGHASVVVDVGVAGRIGDLGTLAELFDTVLLVCGTTPDAVAATSAVLTRWHAEAARRKPQARGGWGERQVPAVSATRLILVPIRIRAGTGGMGGDPVETLVGDGVTVHVMAHDKELASGRPIDLSRLSGASLTAALTLGADVMGCR